MPYGDNKKIEFTQGEINELSCLLGLKIYEEKNILENIEKILELEEVCLDNPTYIEVKRKIQRLERLYNKINCLGDYFKG